MDSIETFIEKIEAEFDDLKKGTLTPATSYKDIEGWSSMQALILVALIDSEYDVILNGEDINSTSTIQDIYNTIISRKA